MFSLLKTMLVNHDIHFISEGESILNPLPEQFGELKYSTLPDGDYILGLVGSEWHTHSDAEGGLEALLDLIMRILN